MMKSPSDVSLFAVEEREDAIAQFKIDTLSRFYAFSSDEIIKYSSVLNFDKFHLMDNPNIIWDIELISVLKGKLDWSAIWKLKNNKIDIDFFKTFENLIDFHSIYLKYFMDR